MVIMQNNILFTCLLLRFHGYGGVHIMHHHRGGGGADWGINLKRQTSIIAIFCDTQSRPVCVRHDFIRHDLMSDRQ